jgi:hypothetical protein
MNDHPNEMQHTNTVDCVVEELEYIEELEAEYQQWLEQFSHGEETDWDA